MTDGWTDRFKEKFGISPWSIGWRDDDMTVRQIGDFIAKEIDLATQAATKRERERIRDILVKLKLTDDSIYNYYDVEEDPIVAKKMTGAYNAALVEVVEALEPTPLTTMKEEGNE